MSKWIDDSFQIEKIDSQIILKSLDQASSWFVSQFEQVEFYKKTVVIEYSGKFLKYDIGFSLGYLNGGIFPGSSFDYSNSNLWQHSLVECYRHFLIYKNSNFKFGFPDNKVNYFATNAAVAKIQIQKAINIKWPMPTIKMHFSYYDEEKKFYLVRTIVDGWKSWNLGPVERFLY